MPDLRDDPKHFELGPAKVRLPASRILRIPIGVALILAGIFGWLPILGFWMIPLGLLVLSYDIPLVARWREKVSEWWKRRRSKRARK
jgi:hypothetical protein